MAVAWGRNALLEFYTNPARLKSYCARFGAALARCSGRRAFQSAPKPVATPQG